MVNTRAHDLAAELRKLADVLARHPDPGVAEGAAPCVKVAADVIVGLADRMVWTAGSGDELAAILCRLHTWAQCDLAAYGPGEDGARAWRVDQSARALDLGFRMIGQIETLTRALGGAS